MHTGTEFYDENDASNTERDQAFSGNAGLSYVFNSGFAPYLSYTESFQPTIGATADSKESFKPTEGRQYELGVKYQPPGTNALLSAAVYDLRQQNVSVTENINGVSVTSQTGEVKVQGLELEATADINESLKVVAAYSYTDTEVLDGVDKGKRLQLVPRNQASLWTDYTWRAGFLDGFGIGGGVRYVGDTYGNTANTYEGHVGSYTVYDAAVHYDLGRLDSGLAGASVSLNATNLFNKDYLSTCNGFWCYYGDERKVVASATYQW
ncbi:Ferrichrome outer membrane transporter/phage receptor [compost metagenome]